MSENDVESAALVKANVTVTTLKRRAASQRWWRKYYPLHRDEILARSRRHYRCHRDERQAQIRRWRAANRERVAAQVARYYLANRSRILAWNRDYAAWRKQRLIQSELPFTGL